MARRRSIILLLLVGIAGVALLGAGPTVGNVPGPLEPLRPTFSGSVVASRTTTTGPGGIPGGTLVGGALDGTFADVDGDGALDLVTAGRAGDAVAGLPAVFAHPGRGDGTFGPPVVSTSSATAASRLVVADLDGDGHLDAVLGGAGAPARFAVLLGGGDGTFAEASSFLLTTPGVTSGAGLLAARLDADADPDLAVVATAGQVAVLLGGGDGTFAAPFLVPSGQSADDLAAVDLDADGDLDLVVADSLASALVPLVSDGGGNFSAAPPIALPAAPGRVVAVDVVGDSRPDLVATGTAGSAIVRNDGNLSFAVHFSSGSGGLGRPAVLDADGDGDLDVVIGIPGTVLIGDGLGGFATPGPGLFLADVGSFGSSVGSPADLDGDGRDDLLTLTGGGAVSANADRSMTPCLQKGTGFRNPRVASLGFQLGPMATGTPAGVVAADVNGDGIDDVATAFTSTLDGISYAAISFGAADGSGPGTIRLVPIGLGTLFATAPAAIAAADFDGDGTDDLVIANSVLTALPAQISVLFGNRQGNPILTHLPSNIPLGTGLAGLVAVTTGDFDGDGNLDIVGFQAGGGTPPALLPSQACIHLGVGQGAFAPVGPIVASRTNSSRVPTGDLDGDGRDDLVLRVSPTALSILPGTANGFFAPPIPVVVPPGGGEAAGDLDGDGLDDLIVFPAAAGGSDLATLRSLGSFVFGSALLSAVGTPDAGLGAVALADFNGDGRLDVATDGTAGGTANLGVFVQRADGIFVHLSLATLSDGIGIAAGDLDGDGRIDLVNAAVLAGSPIFHEWFRNTTLTSPTIRDADRTKAKRGETVTVDVELRNVPAGFRADLGPLVDVVRHEARGGDRFRLHVTVRPGAAPGERSLIVVRPDGDEGSTGLEGTSTPPRENVLLVLEDGVGPTIKKAKYPGRSDGYLPAGHEAFTLKLKGSGFLAGATVWLSDTSLETGDPKKGKKLKADVRAEDVATPGNREIQVINPAAPGSNVVILPVIGPEIDEGEISAREDGTLKIKLRGRNFRKDGFRVDVRVQGSGAPLTDLEASRSSKSKIKIKVRPPTPVLPSATTLEIVVSYLGSLGGRIESDPFAISVP